MILKMNGEDYKVKFGIGFLRELDEKYYTEAKNGIRFGMGLEVKLPMLLADDVITLSEFLYCGTCTEEKRPAQEQIDSYIDETADIEKLFSEVIGELKKHNATKLTVRKNLELLQEQKNDLERRKTETKTH